MWLYRRNIRWALTVFTLLTLGGYLVGYTIIGCAIGGDFCPSFHDYGAAYQAGWRVLNAFPVYDQAPKQYPLPYNHLGDNFYLYIPAAVFLYLPFSQLAFVPSAIAFLTVGLSGLLLALRTLVKELSFKINKTYYVFGIIAVLGFWPTKQWIYMGQVTGFLTLAYTISAILLIRNNTMEDDLGVGIASSICTMMKIYHLPANAHLLRSPVRLVGGAVGAISMIGVSVVVFGFDTFLQYIKIVVRWYSIRNNPTAHPTLAGAPYKPMMFFGEYHLIFQILFILITLSIVIFSIRHSQREVDRYVYILGISTVCFAVPGVKNYTLMIIIPAIVIALHTEWAGGGIPELPVLAVLLIHIHKPSMTLLYDIFDQIGIIHLFELMYPVVQPALLGVIILYGLSIWRILQISGVFNGTWPRLPRHDV